jgi:TonB family protein
MAKRYKRYPRAAVDNNWEGKVDLRMIVAANGTIASLSIRKSAGYIALDDEAQQMFRTAKAQITVPPALRGREFTVDISADFYFRE